MDITTTEEKTLTSVIVMYSEEGTEETINCMYAGMFEGFLYLYSSDTGNPFKMISADIIVEVTFNYAVHQKASVHPIQ